MKRFFRLLPLLFGVLLLSASAGAAQTNAPETRPITDLRALLPAGERPLLVNFWATWCGPCRVEFPELVRIDREYRPQGLDFVLVSVDEKPLIDTRVPEFLAEYEAAMPSYLLDLAGRRAKARAVRRLAPRFPDAYPLTLLFDRRGRLVYQKLGVIDGRVLRAQIDKVLQNKPASR